MKRAVPYLLTAILAWLVFGSPGIRAALPTDWQAGLIPRLGSTGQMQYSDAPPIKLMVGTYTADVTGTCSRTKSGWETYTRTTTLVGMIQTATRSATVTQTQYCATIPATAVTPVTAVQTFTVTFPAGTSKTFTSVFTQNATDVGSTTPAAGVIVMAGTDGQIGTAFMTAVTASIAAKLDATASASFVQTSAIEGTGTATSSLSSKLVNGADNRLPPSPLNDVSKFHRSDGQWATPTLAVPTSDVINYYYAVGSLLAAFTDPQRKWFDDYACYGTGITANNCVKGYSTADSSGTGPALTLVMSGNDDVAVYNPGTGTGTGYIRTYNGGNGNVFYARPDLFKWFVAFKMSLSSTTVGSTFQVGVGLRNANPGTASIQCGAMGAASTTHFGCLFGTNTIDTGINLDTNTHVFIIYHASSNQADAFYVVMDGVAVGNATYNDSSVWGSGGYIRHAAYTGAGSGVSLNSYWWVFSKQQ